MLLNRVSPQGPDVDLDFLNGSFKGGALDALLTTSRTGTALATDSSHVATSFAANVLRYLPGTGLLAENSATNNALWCRDGTNAAWTKSANMTAAKTSTGIDGAANSCTRLTANGAGNQTITQAITLASGNRTVSFYLKRITGTDGAGAIQITLDNGGTWTTVTTVANTWVRRTFEATVTNPTIGIRIVTDTHAVDFDFAHLETQIGTATGTNAGASSPILTTTAAVTRPEDKYTTTGLLSAILKTRFRATVLFEMGGCSAVNYRYLSNTPGQVTLAQNNSVTQVNSFSGVLAGNWPSGNNTTAHKVGMAWTSGRVAISINGGTPTTGGGTPTFGTGDSGFLFDKAGTADRSPCGYCTRFRVWARRALPDYELQRLAA